MCVKNLGPGKSVPVDNPFCSPDLIPKLASNPETAAYLQDQSYMQILSELRADSKALGRYDQIYVTFRLWT